jgi:hypothetical protein
MAEKQKSLADYNEGDIYKGETITTLYAAKPDYLIFEGNDSGEVTVATDNPEIRKRCSEISQQISIVTEYLVTRRQKQKYIDQIGLAYTEAIEGNIEEAKKISNKLITRIELYKINLGRFYYLLSCLSIVIIALVFSYFLKRYRFIPEIIPQFFIMTYASIGGFLSVAKDIKKIQVDSAEFGWFQWFYGATRILISMLSGLIIYVLVKSELILPGLNAENNDYIVCMLAIVAGFSESMIPNLLKRIEEDKTIKK